MKKIIYISLLTVVFIFNACKEDKAVFDEPASIRMQKALAEYSELLASSPNGWFGNFYPEENHKVGGYAMFLQFDSKGKVKISCEIETNVPAAQMETSDWQMIAEQGPVLSFLTYNPVIHYFTEPSATDIDGQMGDYEFVVMKASGDTIELKGKKHNNRFILWRNTENIDPAAYLREVAVLEDNISRFATFHLELGGTPIGEAGITDRSFSIGYKSLQGDSVTTTAAFAFTPVGISLYEPLTVNNVTMKNFRWDAPTEKYVCTDAGVNASFDAYFRPDYQLAYSEYLGSWNIHYHGSSTTVWSNDVVQIKQKKKNATYMMSCSNMFSFEGIELSFDAQRGTVSILVHNTAIQPITKYSIRVCAYSRPDGYYSFSPVPGVNGLAGIWNRDAGGSRTITFVDNGRWIEHTATGFLLRLFDETTNMGNFNANIANAWFSDITMTKNP